MLRPQEFTLPTDFPTTLRDLTKEAPLLRDEDDHLIGRDNDDNLRDFDGWRQKFGRPFLACESAQVLRDQPSDIPKYGAFDPSSRHNPFVTITILLCLPARSLRVLHRQDARKRSRANRRARAVTRLSLSQARVSRDLIFIIH